MTDNPNRDAVLEALARKWHKKHGRVISQDDDTAARQLTYKECADELEAALQSLPEPRIKPLTPRQIGLLVADWLEQRKHIRQGSFYTVLDGITDMLEKQASMDHRAASVADIPTEKDNL